jgi:hypothetical protein
MRLEAIIDNSALSSANALVSGFEQSKRDASTVFEGEDPSNPGSDVVCVAAESHPLHARLEAFDLYTASVVFPFTERLARDNMWDATFATQVCGEYKKFLFLACTADHVVTPSEQVDEAWHLHLIYTKSYWEDLCPNILERPLHHDPTEGGEDRQEYFRDCYTKTLVAYECAFGEMPPADIWPDVNSRLNSVGCRRNVDLKNFWVVKKLGWPSISQVAVAMPGLGLLALGLWGLVAGSDKVQSIALASFGFAFFIAPFTWSKDWAVGSTGCVGCGGCAGCGGCGCGA